MTGFQNNFNNNYNDKSVNTRIKTFYCNLSSLQLGYWNDNISIKINPLLSVNADGIRQYDYNRRANTALSAEKCLALANKIKENMLDKIKKVSSKEETLDTTIMEGVPVSSKNGTTIVSVEYKVNESGVPSVYLIIYTGITNDGKAPQEGIFAYEFNKTSVIDSYNPETGETIESFVESEFLFFYEKLSNIADTFGTAAHSVNNDKKGQSQVSQNGGFNQISQTSGVDNSYSANVSSFTPDFLPFQ